MKTIPLTQGKVALVDDEDFDWLNQWNWHAQHIKLKNSEFWYAYRTSKKIAMHREIARRAGLPTAHDYDHRDGNGLNNQRYNLRPATRSQNRANSPKRHGCTSHLKGVCWKKDRSKWAAQITVNGKVKNLGYFIESADAAKAYAAAAQRAFGEFAHI